jgi:hypothetical protein
LFFFERIQSCFLFGFTFAPGIGAGVLGAIASGL